MNKQNALKQMMTAGLIIMMLVGCSTSTKVPAREVGSAHTPAKKGQHAYTFKGGRSQINYLLFLPKNYGENQGQKWPLILFLHGMGERGNDMEDLELVKQHGPPKLVEQKENFPFLVVSPQCTIKSNWVYELDVLNALLDKIVDTYAVDTDRLYLTGLSMGGFGTWHLALRYPKRFAAIVPIAGGYSFRSIEVPDDICKLKDVPVWAFHGAQDKVIPFNRSEVLVNALKRCGGDVHFKLYPDAKHDSWTETYNSIELYRWLQQHSK